VYNAFKSFDPSLEPVHPPHELLHGSQQLHIDVRDGWMLLDRGIVPAPLNRQVPLTLTTMMTWTGSRIGGPWGPREDLARFIWWVLVLIYKVKLFEFREIWEHIVQIEK
jgi:hypothetical protein